jgi:hypothetical protein
LVYPRASASLLYQNAFQKVEFQIGQLDLSVLGRVNDSDLVRRVVCTFWRDWAIWCADELPCGLSLTPLEDNFWDRSAKEMTALRKRVSIVQ